MSKERAIPFRDWEVLATLDGRKRVFRRPMKKQPSPVGDNGQPLLGVALNPRFPEGGVWDAQYDLDNPRALGRCPYGVPGDTLRAQEAHMWERSSIGLGVRYRADGALLETDETIYADTVPTGRWRPSTQMPAWASRIRLRVVSVGAERVQDVTHESAFLEGVGPLDLEFVSYPSWRSEFFERWIDCYGRESWDRNDWVWWVEFERVAP